MINRLKSALSRLRDFLHLKDKKHITAFIVALITPGGIIAWLAYVLVRRLKKRKKPSGIVWYQA